MLGRRWSERWTGARLQTELSPSPTAWGLVGVWSEQASHTFVANSDDTASHLFAGAVRRRRRGGLEDARAPWRESLSCSVCARSWSAQITVTSQLRTIASSTATADTSADTSICCLADTVSKFFQVPKSGSTGLRMARRVEGLAPRTHGGGCSGRRLWRSCMSNMCRQPP